MSMRTSLSQEQEAAFNAAKWQEQNGSDSPAFHVHRYFHIPAAERVERTLQCAVGVGHHSTLCFGAVHATKHFFCFHAAVLTIVRDYCIPWAHILSIEHKKGKKKSTKKGKPISTLGSFADIPEEKEEEDDEEEDEASVYDDEPEQLLPTVTCHARSRPSVQYRLTRVTL